MDQLKLSSAGGDGGEALADSVQCADATEESRDSGDPEHLY